MDSLLRKIEKLVPTKVYHLAQPMYHFGLTLVGAIKYDFPANKIKVIGITGTKGKSSTTELINHILETAGKKTAVSGTIRFKIGDEERPNKYKMSMPGRFFMQKFLSDAVKAGCEYAVIEMTSEGSKQFRHKFIYTDAFIFTNLSPEHIESHGSYEAYKKAKVRMVQNLNKKKGVLIVNNDDNEAEAFNSSYTGVKIPYSIFELENMQTEPSISFTFQKETFTSPLQGKFNVYNILAAIKTAIHFDVPLNIIQKAISEKAEIAGRVQKINNNLGADIVVDYAHTPDSLAALYESFKDKRTVCILGNTGGGRDTWKRPRMGEIASSYCDHVILTNEDPYDEDPMQIINEMKESISKDKLEIILDRREAIKKGISLLKHGDALLITGKGTDPYIMEANGKKTPWSDSQVVAEILEELE